MSVLTSEMGQL